MDYGLALPPMSGRVSGKVSTMPIAVLGGKLGAAPIPFARGPCKSPAARERIIFRTHAYEPESPATRLRPYPLR